MLKRRVSWMLLPLALACAGCEPEIDAKAKADELRTLLNRADTLKDFIGIAVAEGFDCKHSTETEANCWWYEPDKPSWTSLVPCAEIISAINASGNFVEGRRQGDYVVKDSYTGC